MNWLVGSLTAGALACLVASAPATPSHTVALDGDRMSVSARSARLADVLGDIAQRSGIDIKVESLLEDYIAKETAVEFSGLSLEDGLRRLLQGKHLILLYDAARLTEVRIYLDGTGTYRSLKPAPSAPNPVAQTKLSEHPTPVKAAMAPGAERLAVQRAQERERRERPDLQEVAARLEAAEAHGDDSETKRAALEVLEQNADAEAREMALAALAGLESVPVGPLLRLAQAEGNVDVRVHALHILAERAGTDPRVVALLTQLLANSNGDIREAAASLLESVRTPPSASVTVEAAGPAQPQPSH